MGDGFSPAQLVDQLAPLRRLPDDLQNEIKKAVHETYLATSYITSLEKSIRKCALALQPELNNLRKLWGKSFSPEYEVELRACWENIRKKGEALRQELEKLPRGVILP